jgi:hypothetical protein
MLSKSKGMSVAGKRRGIKRCMSMEREGGREQPFKLRTGYRVIHFQSLHVFTFTIRKFPAKGFIKKSQFLFICFRERERRKVSGVPIIKKRIGWEREGERRRDQRMGEERRVRQKRVEKEEERKGSTYTPIPAHLNQWS